MKNTPGFGCRTMCAAASAIVLGLCASARAGFQVSSVRYTSGDNDIVVFSALNDGTGGQSGSTELQSMDVTMTSIGAALIFAFQDIDGDNIADANVLGYGVTFPTSAFSQMPGGTFMRIGSFSAFSVPSIDSGGVSPAPYSNGGSVDPLANYADLNTFSVEGTDLGSGVEADVTPVPFAVAVVPTGTEVDISGYLSSEITEDGSTVEISAADSTPEPGSASMLLLAGVGFLLRRRPGLRSSKRSR